MSLHENIKEKIKEAMKNRDEVALRVYRGLSASFTNELVSKGRTPQELLEDEESLNVIIRTAKQRRDAIDQFERGGRKDLADEDRAELLILEQFLPKMMTEEEILKILEEKKKELGIDDATKKGMLMAEAMKILKGKADGALVKKVVDNLFPAQGGSALG